MAKNKKIDFEAAIASTDYGLIICGDSGRLKGLWIPEGADGSEVPDAVVILCKQYFGIDPNDETSEILH